MYQANMLCRDLIMEQQQKDDEIYIIMSLLLLPFQKQQQVGGTEKDVHHQYLPIVPLDSEHLIQATKQTSEYKGTVDEYRVFCEYTLTQKKYLEWRESLSLHESLSAPVPPVHRRDLGPTENEGAEIQYEQDMRYYQDKMREFCYQILRKCESVRERIKKVMLTVVGSMDDYLKMMMLPRLANQLHSVDYDTAQWINVNVLPVKAMQIEFQSKSINCLKESLRVAEMLADNDASYLNVFDNGGDAKPNELDFLLQRIRHSAVALFEMQNDL